MIFLVILLFVVYSLLGIMICYKLDVLYDNDDVIDTLVDGLLISFWPVTVVAHFLLDD